MKDPEKNTPNNAQLRQRAEKELGKTPEPFKEFRVSDMSAQEIQKLVHELCVHQIELQMQNEELRRAYGELEKMRDEYSHLYDFAPVGYFSITEKSMITKANLTSTVMLGTDRQELLGKPFSHFIFRDDQDIFYLHMKSLLESGMSQSFSLRLMRTDTTQFHAHLTCMPLEDMKENDDEPGLIRMSISDVTEQKQAEDHLRLFRHLIDQANDAVYIVDPETGRFLDMSARACYDLKYTREELLNMKVFDFERTFPDNLAWDQHVSKLRKKKSLFLEGRVRRKDRSVFPVEVNAKFITHGDREYIVAAVRDVTERKAFEEQLHHSQKMESLGIMAGGIAHEFNNLLYIIYGNAELMMDDAAPEFQDKLRSIVGAAERGKTLVRQLCCFCRKTESVFQIISLNARIRSVCQMLETLMPTTIDIELTLASDLYAVNAVPTQIEQILMNLAINAKDAMPDGGKLIFKTENTTHGDEKWVMLTISDTGQGMENKTRTHIFDPFFTTREVGKGTGLGLSVAYGIVINHKGLIFCDSSVGKGTTFTIYLPAVIEVPRLPVNYGFVKDMQG